MIKHAAMSLLIVAAFLPVCLGAASSLNVNGPWYTGSNSGTPFISDAQSAGFTWGQIGTNGTASAGGLWTYFDEVFLSAAGDFITFGFDVTFNDNPDGTGSQAIRLGLFNHNDSILTENLNNTNADEAFAQSQGYFATWPMSSSQNANIMLRQIGYKNPVSGTSSTTLAAKGVSHTLTVSNRYHVTLTVQKVDASQLLIRSQWDDEVIETTTTLISAESFNMFYMLNTPQSGAESMDLSNIRLSTESDAAAVNPFPTHGQTVSIFADELSWSSPISQQVTGFDLYLRDGDSDFYDRDNNLIDIDDGSARSPFTIGSSLSPGKTYFWRVDTHTQNEFYQGPVWMFETTEYITIEDFDAFYANAAGQLPHWVDGSSNNTGASISMYMAGCLDIQFDNRSAPYRSEVSCVFDSAQNWADSGFDTLSFLIRGSPDADAIYVLLEDASGATAVVTVEDSGATHHDRWREMTFSLRQFAGVNLREIARLAFGVGRPTGSSPGGFGEVGFDDIRLYPTPKAHADINADGFVTLSDLAILTEYWLHGPYEVRAVTPDEERLLVYYPFDGLTGRTVQDVSLDQNHAEIRGGSNPDSIRSQTGGIDDSGYIDLDGALYIEIPSAVFSSVDNELTISFWLKQDPNSWCQSIRPLELSTGLSVSTSKDILVWNPEQSPDCVTGWRHYAFVKKTDDGLMRVYRNGIIIAQMTGASESISDMDADSAYIGSNLQGYDRFAGAIDDFRVYGYAMSHNEIAGLYAGPSRELIQPIVPVLVPVEPSPDGRIDLLDFSVLASFWLQDSQ